MRRQRQGCPGVMGGAPGPSGGCRQRSARDPPAAERNAPRGADEAGAALLMPRLWDELPGARLAHLVHDEILLEMPEHLAE